MLPAGRAWLLAAGATLALAAPAGAQPRIEGSLLLESDTAWRVYSPRVAQKSQNRAELDVEVRLGDAWRVRGLGRVRGDPGGRRGAGRGSTRGPGGATSGDGARRAARRRRSPGA